MHAEITLGEIASAAANLFGLRHTSGREFDASADREAITLYSSQFQADPMTSGYAGITKDPRRTVDVFDHEVQLSVIEKIGDGKASGSTLLAERWSGLISSGTEFAVTFVELKHSRLLISGTRR